MKSDTIIVLGSSRSTGNTYTAVQQVLQQNPADFIDLNHYTIYDYSYDNSNQSDDFKNVTEKVLQYKTIILATPIYWYTMSAVMKRFVDRWTDLLDVNTPSFAGKNLAVISSYASYPEGKDGFEDIFKNTAKFLNMNYLGCCFYYAGSEVEGVEENINELEKFVSHHCNDYSIELI